VNIPIFERLEPETWFDHDCRPGLAGGGLSMTTTFRWKCSFMGCVEYEVIDRLPSHSLLPSRNAIGALTTSTLLALFS
jgi:hypothetical protein